MPKKLEKTPERTVEVEMLGEGWIAGIHFDLNGSTNLCRYDQRYEKEISDLLDKIRGQKLSLPYSKNNGASISDGVQFYGEGDEGYVFALAHELSHHSIQGKHIRGIVRSI